MIGNAKDSPTELTKSRLSAVTRLHLLVGEIIDPILFEKQKEVVGSLSSEEMTRVVPDSPYSMTAALVNTLTTDHVDPKDWPGGALLTNLKASRCVKYRDWNY